MTGSDAGGDQFVQFSKFLLGSVFVLTWLLPVYIVSFPLSCMW